MPTPNEQKARAASIARSDALAHAYARKAAANALGMGVDVYKGEAAPYVKPSDIRAARHRVNLNVRQAAALVHYSGSQWGHWENGYKLMPVDIWHQFLAATAHLTPQILDDLQLVARERELWAAHHATAKALEAFYASQRLTTHAQARQRHADLLGH